MNIFIQAVLRKTIIRDSVSQHAAQLFPALEYDNLMTHKSQKICSRQPAWTSADNGYLLPRRRSARRYLHSVGRNLIHRKFLHSADIHRTVDEIPATSLLARMFADHRAGRRERVILPDEIDGIRVILLSSQRNISRNVHMGRTELDARNLLTDPFRTSLFSDVAFIFLSETLRPFEKRSRRLISDGTVRRVADFLRIFYHCPEGLFVAPAGDDLIEQLFQLRQAVSARHTFSAGLIS